MFENNIIAQHYDDKENLLTVTYAGGTVVKYHPVNPETYNEMIAEFGINQAIKRISRLGNIVGTRRMGENGGGKRSENS